MTKTDEELEAILAGTEGVTPGPWDFQQTDYGMSGHARVCSFN
jgi:hypothetical protein